MLEKLTKWNPLRNVRDQGERRETGLNELNHLQEGMNRLFDRFFRDRYAESEDTLWYPQIDISETGSEIVVRAELPGMTKKDVDIAIQDNVLTLQGEKKRKKKTKQESFYYVERSFGHFYQSFALPAPVEQDKVTAEFTRGILTITLPKTEGVQPKRIAIVTS